MVLSKQKIKLLGFLCNNSLVKSSIDIFEVDTVILSENLSKIGKISDLLGPLNSPLYFVELQNKNTLRISDPLFTEEESFLYHETDSELSKTSEEEC
jgi:rRNA processing protein Gar1